MPSPFPYAVCRLIKSIANYPEAVKVSRSAEDPLIFEVHVDREDFRHLKLTEEALSQILRRRLQQAIKLQFIRDPLH